METIRAYLDAMFKDFPDTKEVSDLKQNMLEHMEDKFQELMSEGCSQHEAIGRVIEEFGSIEELMKEMGIETNQEVDASLDKEHANKIITREDALAFIKVTKGNALMVAMGVSIIICAVGMQDMISRYRGDSIANIIMFSMIAISVAMFIYAGYRSAPYEHIGKPGYMADAFTKDEFVKERKAFKPKEIIATIIGVVICILTPAMYSLFEDRAKQHGTYEDTFLPIFFLLIAIAVFLFVYFGMRDGGYKRITEVKEIVKLEEEKKLQKANILAGVLFPLTAFAYVGIGMMDGRFYRIGWIMFPVVSIIIFAYRSILQLKD